MLDLKALEEVETEPGKPLLVDIDLVIEDPQQPRQEFNEKALQELADDIKERGVKNPVSVKPANEDGKYILNAGARRRRAAIIAGLSQIPVFIDHDFTDYDQVNENEQRSNLTPMELALFVQKRLNAGDKAVEIARKLRKDRSDITHLKALLELPDCLMSLYRDGRCTVARRLYDLKIIYDNAPDKVSEWCQAEHEVTRKTILELKASIESVGKEAPGPSSDSATNAEANLSAGQDVTTEGGKAGTVVSPSAAEPKKPKAEESDRIKKPLLIVRHGKRSATLLLDKRPTREGHAFIRYEGVSADEAVVEVSVNSLRIDRLMDASAVK